MDGGGCRGGEEERGTLPGLAKCDDARRGVEHLNLIIVIFPPFDSIADTASTARVLSYCTLLWLRLRCVMLMLSASPLASMSALSSSNELPDLKEGWGDMGE